MTFKRGSCRGKVLNSVKKGRNISMVSNRLLQLLLSCLTPLGNPEFRVQKTRLGYKLVVLQVPIQGSRTYKELKNFMAVLKR